MVRLGDLELTQAPGTACVVYHGAVVLPCVPAVLIVAEEGYAFLVSSTHT